MKTLQSTNINQSHLGDGKVRMGNSTVDMTHNRIFEHSMARSERTYIMSNAGVAMQESVDEKLKMKQQRHMSKRDVRLAPTAF